MLVIFHYSFFRIQKCRKIKNSFLPQNCNSIFNEEINPAFKLKICFILICFFTFNRYSICQLVSQNLLILQKKLGLSRSKYLEDFIDCKMSSKCGRDPKRRDIFFKRCKKKFWNTKVFFISQKNNGIQKVVFSFVEIQKGMRSLSEKGISYFRVRGPVKVPRRPRSYCS